MSELPRSADMVESCLTRFDEVEARVHAWAWIDPERARRLAAEADATEPLSPLHGIPIGVKDIIDTAGIPTEYGAVHFKGRVPDRSADLILALEEAGAIIVGKTVSTEVAYFHPGPTTNPWNPAHTSGGSSMGSAAGVAAGMVPLAVGTQTNGSVIRPAAFCGVVGFKPTVGSISTEGVCEFSSTFDTIGSFATSVSAAAVLVAVMSRRPLDDWAPDRPERPRLAAIHTNDFERCEPAMQRCFDDSIAILEAAGAEILRGHLPADLEDVRELHNTIQLYEAYRSLGPVVAGSEAGAFSHRLREALALGASISTANYEAALQERLRLTNLLAAWAEGYDAILTPPALGEAPTVETTGDPLFCSRWSLTGSPSLSLPVGFGPLGLPLGLQLSSPPGTDCRLLGTAIWTEGALGGAS